MRALDRWLGIPLCFLASGLVRMTDLLAGSRRATTPAKVLFIELSEMGSALLADPAMRKIRDASGAELHFAIFAGNAASLRLLGTVATDNVFIIRDDSFLHLAADSLRLLAWTRRRGIDTCIDLELFSRYSALLTGLSGAPNRIGFHAFHNEGLYRGGMLTHRVAFNPHMHIARNFVALINAALSKRDEVPFSKTVISDEEIRLSRATVSDEQLQAMHHRIATVYSGYQPGRVRIALVNPNAGDLLPQRRWSTESFLEVIRRLLEDYPDVLVLITGSAPESEAAEAMTSRARHERCLNFCGRVEFTELPALYSIACLLLTNDSGPGHFSAVTDLPTFVLFGPETPSLYGPLGNTTSIYAGLACSPCVSAWNHRRTPCRDNVCMQSITPDRVLSELRSVLDQDGNGRDR